MMGHELHRSESFWSLHLSIDKDLADSSRQKGCSCGGRLHCANYPRAPRGRPDHLPEEYRCRFSFCCDRDGCRKRMTPPSVRFLGRKVYLGAVVILISAMRKGPTPRRVRELSSLFAVDRATIARWQAFWRDAIPQTPFWKVARARLVPVVQRRRFAFVAAGSVPSHQRSVPGLGASLAISVAAYGPKQSADQDHVMGDDHPQRMHRHRFWSPACIDSGGDIMLSDAMKRA